MIESNDVRLKPILEFAYSQFFVYDSKLKSPACEWTAVHSRQGFARREGAIAVGTLLEFGRAQVTIGFGTPSLASLERVLAVPLTIESGAVAIDGPEESPGVRQLAVEIGHYRVTIGQRRANEAEQEVRIWLQKVSVPEPRSELLIVDDGLDPILPLLETANAP